MSSAALGPPGFPGSPVLPPVPKPHLHQPLEPAFGSFPAPLEPPNPSRLSGLRLEFHPLHPAPHGKQGGLRSRRGAPAPTDPHPQGGQKRLQAGKFSQAAPSAAKSLWPQPKSHQLRAWRIPQRAGHGAHGGSGGLMERWEGSAHLGSMPESLPSWHGQAQTRWQCPAGSGTQCHRGGGHRGTQRQGEKVPGKAWPGAGGAAGTAQPRGSCNTEKPGSACQARGSSGSLPCRLESRPGGRGARGRQENTPGSLC